MLSDSLPPHGLQHVRVPYPLLSPRVCSDLCPLSQCCHLISSSSVAPLSSVAPFSSCPQSFPVLGCFPMSQLFISGGQSIGVSASASVFNEYSWMISLRTDWFDLNVQGTLKGILQHHNSKASVLCCSVFFMVQLSQLYMTTGKTITLTIWT